MTRLLVPAVALLAIAWLAVLVATPLLPAPVAAVLYAAGSLICHQIPERSFHLGAFQLPVCARCVGLYAGGAVGAVVALAPAVRPLARRHAVTLLAALPTAATFILEHGAGWPMSNTVRAAAAVPLAGVVAFVVMRALATLHYDECLPRRPIDHGPPPATPT